MGRHIRDYHGERFTAHLGLWLTPSDRAAMERGAAELEMKLSDYARMLILNGLRAQEAAKPKRDAQRAAITAAIGRLNKLGLMLNDLVHDANLNREIRKASLVERVGHALMLELKQVPPPGRSRTMDQATRKLVAELRAIGNNVDQMRRMAKSSLLIGVAAVMDDTETALAELLNATMP